MRTRSPIRAVLLLVFALSYPFLLNYIFAFGTFGLSNDAAMVLSQCLELGLCGAVLWIAIRMEGLSLSDLGIAKPTASTLTLGLGMLLCLKYSGYAAMYLTSRWHWTAQSEMATSLSAQPKWMLVLTSITAGIAEESIYRGYAIAQLKALTGRTSFAALVTIMAFTFGHFVSWGFGPWLIGQLTFAIIFTGFYLWKRDLIANVFAHSAMDVFATLGLWG